MYDETARKAINAALNRDWKLAVDINLNILKKIEDDINALNRISQAYLQLGELEKSRKYAELVIKYDNLNTLGKKCLEKIKLFEENNLKVSTANKVAPPHTFIEEPGKTKIVSLINICETSLLITLSEGECVYMKVRRPKVVITTANEHYIGRLPDDLAYRIISLKEHGKDYEAYIKSINNDKVRVFIKESHSSNGVNFTSFPLR